MKIFIDKVKVGKTSEPDGGILLRVWFRPTIIKKYKILSYFKIIRQKLNFKN